jgi:ABC-type nitrate/sulfonate/bicarbonate transport system substrate-binding protein
MRQIGVALLFAFLAGCGGSAPEPATELQKIVIAYPTRSSQAWPLYTTIEGGYFKKYGLDVTLTFAVHPAPVAMVIADQAVMTPYTLESSMQAALGDASLTAVGAPFKKSSFALVAHKDIASVAALKGKRIAVSQLGDAPYNYTVGLLASAGLTARDIEWIPVGTGIAARAAAVVGNRADATMLTAPDFYKLEREGYKVLANIAEDDSIFAPAVYLMRKSSGADLAERIVKAHAEGIKRFYDDKAFAVESYLKWDMQERADVERAYDDYYRPRCSTSWRIPPTPPAPHK